MQAHTYNRQTRTKYWIIDGTKQNKKESSARFWNMNQIPSTGTIRWFLKFIFIYFLLFGSVFLVCLFQSPESSLSHCVCTRACVWRKAYLFIHRIVCDTGIDSTYNKNTCKNYLLLLNVNSIFIFMWGVVLYTIYMRLLYITSLNDDCNFKRISFRRQKKYICLYK